MTVGELLKHLTHLRHDLQQFQDRLTGDSPGGQTETPSTRRTEFESFQGLLRKRYHHLKENLSTWSEACLSINLESGRTTDLYESFFSDQLDKTRLDWVRADLEQIVAALSIYPQDQPLPAALRQHRLAAKNAASAFGLLGHHGQTRDSVSTLTLHEVLQRIGALLREHISKPEDQETLQNHLNALLTHPAMVEALAQPFPLHSFTPSYRNSI